jgi:hypothetical protein
MKRQQMHTHTCPDCGCEHGRPDPDPTDTLCDTCRWKHDRYDEISHLRSLLESASFYARMHDRKGVIKALKSAQTEINSVVKFLE